MAGSQLRCERPSTLAKRCGRLKPDLGQGLSPRAASADDGSPCWELNGPTDTPAQLSAQAEFDLAGLDIVINRHLHFDHRGGNHLFTGKPIYVQRIELDDARSNDDDTIREWVDAPGVQYVLVDGELELLPGIRFVPTPRHTRGSQLVVVETGGEPVVVCWPTTAITDRTGAGQRPGSSPHSHMCSRGLTDQPLAITASVSARVRAIEVAGSVPSAMTMIRRSPRRSS